ncbi:MAG: hypothetical protein FD130_858 [Halothiobacillaceae bacterium]|nr:MAG: hypothetical protein FD130_858 [Halothiobacillaceae bacterium]
MGEKRAPAAEVIGDIVFTQHALKEARLMIAAIEDGIVTKVGTVFKAVAYQLRHHLSRLMLLVANPNDPQGITIAQITP